MTDEYAAGFFDGEGHVGISVQKRLHRYHGYLLELHVTNTNLPILERFKSKWGGSISPLPERPNNRPCWVWKLSAAQAEPFLHAIRPHAVLKRRQIEIALEFRDLFKGENSLR